ncbi:MAG: hypothetical protein Ct9H300mP10_06180 [Methanobacteriota archaeon]|nr:MAG: hypothetical protein Ct9H300mP10_06180 [Euryarchaeota archaeon]
MARRPLRCTTRSKGPPEHSRIGEERGESWDATEPATVYKTPEILPDGTHCTAATVNFRTRGCAWWWKSGFTFCGYFNDVRDDVTADDLFAQWDEAKLKGRRLRGLQHGQGVHLGGLFLRIVRTLPSGRRRFSRRPTREDCIW